MDINFAAALRTMDVGADFRVANQARPPANYLFSQFLPELPRETYSVKSGGMVVRTTMAGLASMDSPYPPIGVVETSTQQEQTAKIAGQSRFTEESLRELQALVARQIINGGGTNQVVVENALNFLNKVIIQAHLDTTEWMRGQALVNNGIDWTFGPKRLQVSYLIPAENILAPRTGNDAYHGTASKFWTDIATIQQRLRYNVRAYILHVDTLNAILANPANNIQITAQQASRVSIRRMVQQNGTNTPSSDARESIDLVVYSDEAEIYDDANPGKTRLVPFMPRWKILGVGNATNNAFVVGTGATQVPPNSLGYTHLAPTVEGGGRPGRWARLFTPEMEPWSMVGQAVTNLLPVIENNKLIAISSTAAPA